MSKAPFLPHHNLLLALQLQDDTAFTYLNNSYMIPLLFILDPVTDDYADSCVIIAGTFVRARERILEYTDDRFHTLFLWLIALMLDYLQELPGRNGYLRKLNDQCARLHLTI